MAIPQPPFQSTTVGANGRFNPVWVQWFQQVQQQIGSGSPVIDGGIPSSVYGGSIKSINGGTVGNR